MVVTGFAQKVRVDVQGGIEVKAAQIEHVFQVHGAKVHHMVGRTRVHVFDAVGERVQGIGADQVRLADENLVGKADLAARFLAFVELLGRVFGVHQGQDGVQQVGLGHLVVHEKGLRDRARVGQTGGFYDHAIKLQLAFAALFGQFLQSAAQIFADGAAHAAIAHLHDVFLGVAHQNVAVDVFLAKLVLDDSDFLAMRLAQDALEQRGFARAEKTGEDGGRNKGHNKLY